VIKIRTTRFGDLEVPESEMFAFPEGILGFAEVRSYVLLENPKGGPFKWLQAADVPSLAFVVADPALFFPDYKVRVRPEDLAPIQLVDVATGLVLVILTVPRDPQEITANLQGPLILNRGAKLARQLVLSEPDLSTRHKIFKDVT
jgi:flagellar assembly factor FliW